MKKVVINISDCDFEKIRFEAIEKKKSVQDVIKDRILEKEFSPDVITAFNQLMETQLKEILE